MTYQEAVANQMEDLSLKPEVIFLGENIINSKRIYGTLNEVPLKKCIEMPVAENLIAGTAIGLAIEGWRPVAVFQRMDFMLIAADAILNHAVMLPKLSGDQFALPIIFRTIIGSRDPKFKVGPQHTQDYSDLFEKRMKVFRVSLENVKGVYTEAFKLNEPVLVVEDYALYGQEIQSQDAEVVNLTKETS